MKVSYLIFAAALIAPAPLLAADGTAKKAETAHFAFGVCGASLLPSRGSQTTETNGRGTADNAVPRLHFTISPRIIRIAVDSRAHRRVRFSGPVIRRSPAFK